jgi:multimeric flavodoxin WrbA
MKILAVCGSPRKGNTEWMLNDLLDKLSKKGAEGELLLLRKLDIKRCAGCLLCEDRKGICRIQDDMQTLYPKILGSDAIILGTPVYFEMISGMLKNFMDRTCPIWTKMQGKPIAGMAVAEEGIGQAINNMKTYASVCKMRWLGSVTCLAKTPGQASQDMLLARRITRLAGKIILSP